MQIKSKVAMVIGMAIALGSVIADAQMYQGLPAPYNAAPSAIEDQQQYIQPTQRLSPRNQMFLSPVGQPQRYDAVTINRYIMGHPSTDYRIRPVVRTPMYQIPGQ
jgi:hypothetical protein